MNKKFDADKVVELLESIIDNIKDFNGKFIAYNTKFLGTSISDVYKIKGKSTKNSTDINVRCFGYDDTYGELHVLDVYEFDNGKKYAMTEISNGIYAFWDILD